MKFEIRCFKAMCDNNLILILTTLRQNQTRLKALLSKLETFMGMPEFEKAYEPLEQREYADLLFVLKDLIAKVDEALTKLPRTFIG